ncbi:hypothetical protein J4771_03610 [Candidatus Kaistella beijingensis]|jgi:hypothetical protein|uniref:hypothetical protein n=1 Tax=Candidatus Kaistella beijingensis TaxID=2820270 RepID=UPI001AC696DC|nr:hypothetical protein [Candidatus Kaistella beijingensis]MBN8622128.1 hypothetical protein [Flavobacteriales bacterium]MCA0390565.1 hypothetical protein [Bacteroidota bacterium]UBB90455.1 hypothetical protein J4771_03610 [Candidatus Kaistella beijingensis]
MKLKNNTLYIILYFLMFFVHFGIWQLLKVGFETTFIKYYLFLTMLFMMVITILSIIKKIYPTYIGFAFMGLVMFKLMIMFLIMKKLNLSEVPNYKMHFIIPYLISLLLETLYSVKLIQKEDFSNAENSKKESE